MGMPVAVSVSWLSRQPSTRVGSSRACFCACACDYDCESPVVSPYVGSEGLPRTPVFSASKTRWPCIDFDLTCRVSSRHPLHPSPTGAATSAGFPYLSTCWRSVISYRTLWPWSHGPHVPGLSPWPFSDSSLGRLCTISVDATVYLLRRPSIIRSITLCRLCLNQQPPCHSYSVTTAALPLPLPARPPHYTPALFPTSGSLLPPSHLYSTTTVFHLTHHNSYLLPYHPPTSTSTLSPAELALSDPPLLRHLFIAYIRLRHQSLSHTPHLVHNCWIINHFDPSSSLSLVVTSPLHIHHAFPIRFRNFQHLQ